MDTSSPATTAPPVAALPVNPENAENDTGQYTLKAVVTHKGIYSDGGHYVAWVKQDDDSWLLFDDDKVRVADPSDIAKLDGKGGAEWHIAYLCLYATKSS
ncbi:peptidase C19 family protein [Pelomyxa schiedti]|nr:peptidase C19 family protein [Pelomyxa schiedti]